MEEGITIDEKKTVLVDKYIIVEHDLFISVIRTANKMEKIIIYTTQCNPIQIMISEPVSLSSGPPQVIKLANFQV